VEGMLEFARNLRPEFAKHIKTHILDDTEAHRLRGRCKSAFVVRMIGVAQYDGARCSQPLGKINHAFAIVAVRYECMFNRVQETPAAAAVPQSIIPRVLRKDRGIRKLREELR